MDTVEPRFLTFRDSRQHPGSLLVGGHPVGRQRWTRIHLAQLHVLRRDFAFEGQDFLGMVKIILSQEIQLQLADLRIPPENFYVRGVFLEHTEQVLHGEFAVGKLRTTATINDRNRLTCFVHGESLRVVLHRLLYRERRENSRSGPIFGLRR